MDHAGSAGTSNAVKNETADAIQGIAPFYVEVLMNRRINF